MFKCKQASKNIVKIKELKTRFLDEWNSSPRRDDLCIALMKELQNLLEMAENGLSIEWEKYECIKEVDIKRYCNLDFFNYENGEITDNYILFKPRVPSLPSLAFDTTEWKIVQVAKSDRESIVIELSKGVFATANDDGMIIIENTKGKQFAKMKVKGYVSALSKLKNNKISLAAENNIQIWSLKTKRRVNIFECGLDRCTRIQEMKNGNLILADDISSRIEIWNPENKICVRTFNFDSKIPLSFILEIREGEGETIEVIRNKDPKIYICDIKKNEVRIKGEKSKKCYSVIFASDGSVIECAEGDREPVTNKTTMQDVLLREEPANVFIVRDTKKNKVSCLGSHDFITHIKELPNHLLVTVDDKKVWKTWGIPGEDNKHV